jgi:hypothetical protein
MSRGHAMAVLALRQACGRELKLNKKTAMTSRA